MVTAEVACVILEGYSVCIMKKMCAQHMNSTHPFKLPILSPTADRYCATPAHCAGRLVGGQFAHSPPFGPGVVRVGLHAKCRRLWTGVRCQRENYLRCRGSTLVVGPLLDCHLMLPRLFSIHGVQVEGTDQMWARGEAVMGLALCGREKLVLDERVSGTPLKKPGAAPFEVSSWWRRHA